MANAIDPAVARHIETGREIRFCNFRLNPQVRTDLNSQKRESKPVPFVAQTSFFLVAPELTRPGYYLMDLPCETKLLGNYNQFTTNMYTFSAFMEPAAIGHSLVDMWARLDGEGFEGEHAPGPAFEEALRYFDGHFDELKERTGIVRQRASLTFNSGSGLLEVRYPQIFSGNTKRAKEANSNVLGNLGQLKLSWAFKQMCGKPENFGGYLKVLFGEESLENLLSYTEANTRGFDRTEFLRLD